MDPSTAEILALASYPRFDPNDFISSPKKERQREKTRNINHWFENEAYLASLWNQQHPLEKEHWDPQTTSFYDEQRFLTWDTYLDFILLPSSSLRQSIKQVNTLSQAIHVQRECMKLEVLFPSSNFYAIFNLFYREAPHQPYEQRVKSEDREQILLAMQHPTVLRIKQQLDPYFNDLPNNYDKVLFIDLCRLAVDEKGFSPSLLSSVGKMGLEEYHDQTGSLVTLMSLVKEKAKELHHKLDFKAWRETDEQAFLKRKRIEETLSKQYPKPYLDYLDQQEQTAFQAFWEAHKWDCLYPFLTGQPTSSDSAYVNYFCEEWGKIQEGGEANAPWKKAYDCLEQAIKPLPSQAAVEYLQTMRPYDALNRPLLGRYRLLRQAKNPLEKHLAAAFYPVYGFGHGRSYAYRQAAIQGSLFKLVTAYEALVQRFRKLDHPLLTPRDLNPLIIVDEVYQQGQTRYVGYTDDGKPIPQLYKGGRLPRSLAHQHNGRVDLLRALEVSSNPYFSLLASECLEDPSDLARAAKLFSFGKRTGIDLPAEIPGKVPDDLASNRTGLYAMAIGQHSLVVTPLQTAVMLAAIANGGKVLKPKIVKLTAGRQLSREEDAIICPPSFPYQETLALVGIDFPLFAAHSFSPEESLIKTIPTEIKQEIFMPEIVRQLLLTGLRAVTQRTYQESLSSLTRLYREHPEAIRQLTALKNQLLGKTSTSESVENIDLDFKEGTNIYTHVWFGSIAFAPHEDKQKEATILFKDEFGQPELIVVIYLRYGGYGKEAAPLAAQIVQKWRDIKQKYAAD